jgi:hypothetical protein
VKYSVRALQKSGARLVAVRQAEHVRRHGDVVVDVTADRILAALDRVFVGLHVLAISDGVPKVKQSAPRPSSPPR